MLIDICSSKYKSDYMNTQRGQKYKQLRTFGIILFFFAFSSNFSVVERDNPFFLGVFAGSTTVAIMIERWRDVNAEQRLGGYAGTW